MKLTNEIELFVKCVLFKRMNTLLKELSFNNSDFISLFGLEKNN